VCGLKARAEEFDGRDYEGGHDARGGAGYEGSVFVGNVEGRVGVEGPDG